MNVPLGGENRTSITGKKIEANGNHGHLYLYHMTPKKDRNGGLLIGVEGIAANYLYERLIFQEVNMANMTTLEHIMDSLREVLYCLPRLDTNSNQKLDSTCAKMVLLENTIACMST